MNGKLYVVTGGGGFVGQALCKKLLENGHSVVSIARGEYPELKQMGVTTVRGDLGSSDISWQGALEGADGVFHTAAKVDLWGRYKDFFQANVLGTRNVVEGSRLAGVKRIVFTSSPSVIAGHGDLRGVDESYPYPKKHLANYPLTKMISEQEILKADNTDEIRTVSLRPHLIWGPGDRHLVPTILERAKAGRLVKVGGGKNLTDTTYIDDCVQGHICAMRALEERPDLVGGKAYFISQNEPVNLWDWINQILSAHKVPPITRTVPVSIAWGVACVAETVSRIFASSFEPILTRILVHEMATDHYFNISRAMQDL